VKIGISHYRLFNWGEILPKEKLKLEELINTDEPGWPTVQGWLDAATNPVEILPARDPDRAEALVVTQVTTRSPMGAIIYETGGLLIDFGWLRILGSGHPRLPRTLPGWNLGRTIDVAGRTLAFFLIADDVLGGFFAINGGGLGEGPRNVFYFAPDSLAWEDMEMGYSDFIQWCLSGDVKQFYGDYRWAGWEAEVLSMAGDRGYFIFPPIWMTGPPISERRRGTVPMAELYGLHIGECG
jgi:uncharacterized protein DUF2625